MNILITAFEPFGGDQLNPTQMILDRLPDTAGACEIKKLLLPVEFIRSRQLAFEAYDRLSPSAVIMLGQAGGRSSVSLETTGKNVMNARIPDNAGYAPEQLPVVEGGPAALSSTLPADEIVQALTALGIPCEKSGDAGEYVCNTLLYGMLWHNKGNVPTGFIHVPYIPEQGHEDKPSMTLDDLVRGVTAAAETVTGHLSSDQLSASL